MKPLIPLLALATALATSQDIHAQSVPDGKIVQYTYDASGNRIKRTVTVQTKSPSAIGDSIPNPYEYISWFCLELRIRSRFLSAFIILKAQSCCRVT